MPEENRKRIGGHGQGGCTWHKRDMVEPVSRTVAAIIAAG